MKKGLSVKPIAVIRTDFGDKFGVPRQSGLASSLKARIVFEKEFRSPDAVKGIGDFSHLWLLWLFSENPEGKSSLTVRPPRLGGNKRVGVFATRSPFRPNPIGLSSVKLEEVVYDKKLGTVLIVSGADLVDGTPILDIKPYLAYTDSHPDASCGFAAEGLSHVLEVRAKEEVLSVFPEEKGKALCELLSLDPRPSYQDDPDRIYGLDFGGCEVKFTVSGDVLTVIEAAPREKYYVYMLRCAGDTVYTGSTNDPKKRMRDHFEGTGSCAKFTRAHPPESLAALFLLPDKSSALKLEHRIKTLTRAQKDALIASPETVRTLFSGEFSSAVCEKTEKLVK